MVSEPQKVEYHSPSEEFAHVVKSPDGYKVTVVPKDEFSYDALAYASPGMEVTVRWEGDNHVYVDPRSNPELEATVKSMHKKMFQQMQVEQESLSFE